MPLCLGAHLPTDRLPPPPARGAQVEKAEQDKQSAIIRAQGEAQSATLIGQAVQQNPAFLTLRKIEAAREIASTVSGSANRIFLNSDSLLLNLSDYETKKK